MSDDEDFMSDKFLANVSSPSSAVTYSERRRQAQRESAIKNAQNRTKKRKQLEDESLQEGLSKSLFERVQEEEQTVGKENKAMAMMKKMGFKPGQPLGLVEASAGTGSSTPDPATTPKQSGVDEIPSIRHRTDPLPLDLWTGKKGVGLGKRTVPPENVERLVKMAKLAEANDRETYRERTRQAFQERRVEGRLISARRTLLTLDEKEGIKFNVLSLDPSDSESIPPRLLAALEESMFSMKPGTPLSEKDSLKRQMQSDALSPLDELECGENDDRVLGFGAVKSRTLETSAPPHAADAAEPNDSPLVNDLPFSEGDIQDAKDFLTLAAQERFDRVLEYLRLKHYYCFWCGTQYTNELDMAQSCPGEDEEAHD